MYTYNMLAAGLDKDTLLKPLLPCEDHLLECGVDNKIHRIKIMKGIETMQDVKKGIKIIEFCSQCLTSCNKNV